MNTDALRSNYQAVIETAIEGDFGPPPADEWNAEEIIAHLTTNDDLLAATTRDVLAGRPATYDNALAIDTARLSAFIEECGGRDGVIQRLRTSSTRVVDLAEQIHDDLGATLLPVHIVDGTIVRVDEPLPITALFGAQAMVHLPAHLAQLRSLIR